MSKCHFPQDNFTIILDNPSFSNINTELLMIQTVNHLPCPSLMSMTYFDKPQIAQNTFGTFNEVEF